ncbi:hypothetical protein ACFWA9_34410 [Kitasatospora sp. NPDC059973]|uniref:hypothetical protein n=1 Tax=Kitasatospora sp. NPDC059973 TaxID=3347020 RepID=UPI0036CC76A2
MQEPLTPLDQDHQDPDTGRLPMQCVRADVYARCTVQLAHDHQVAGAEGTWDQALTNALTAIVAHQWPGAEADAKGRMLPAAALLGIIEKQLDELTDEPGVYLIPDPNADAERALPQEQGPGIFGLKPLDTAPPPPGTRVRCAVFREGLAATQGVRHARSAEGGLGAVQGSDHVVEVRDFNHMIDPRRWRPAV